MAAAPSTFDGRVFHVHCDPMITAESLVFDFPGQGENKFGVCVPEIFLVVHSADLLAAIQKQLQTHLNGTYNAQSVCVQLGDAEGALGSEMISENLAHRLTNVLNVVRNKACEAHREKYTTGGGASASANLIPTSAGLRIYPKLPEVKGDKDATTAKIRELAIKYGAIADAEGNVRDMSKLDVTIKINIFGFYKGAFYLNYRLIAPFKHREKPEILAETKKARKRAPAAPRKPRLSAGAGGAAADEEAHSDAEGAAAGKRKADGAAAPKKRVRPTNVAADAALTVDPADFSNEDDLALAYVKAGMPLRMATQKAMEHFSSAEAAPSFRSLSRAMSVAGGGAGAGGATESDDE
jgi:hypothetical protein